MIDNIRGWGQCSLVLGLGLETRPRTRLAVKVAHKVSSLLGQLESFSIHMYYCGLGTSLALGLVGR